MDFKKIEEKWQKKWDEKKIFEPEPDSRKKFYLTVAYPYPSGAMHVGHVRTYTVTDIIARFRRMQGYNVLFPMAWHVTGTPIIGALKRLKEKEKKQMFVLKEIFGVKDSDLAKMNEPMDYARYFISDYKTAMKKLGYTVDWRREFTTNDPHYNKFVEWQYLTLKNKGLVKKGLHPVKFCTKCKNPVTAHDLLEGENVDVNEFVLIKFRLNIGNKTVYLPCATLRPETVYGVTNIWVNPKSSLMEAEVDKEIWIISKEAAEKLELQGKKIEIKKEIKAKDLIGKKAENPVLKNKILILPGEFVDIDNATGIVMSVPSHAPFDYIALKDLKKTNLKKFGISKQEVQIKPISVVKTPGYGEHPAVDIIEKNQVKSQKEFERIDALTRELYKKEFHSGILNERCGKYRGKRVSEIKNILVRDFREAGVFDEMFDFSEKVVCRCGGKVVVAKKDSWFLDYGSMEWKQLAKDCLKQICIVPENARSEYEQTIDWLKDWPCIRNFGLGTMLPWDKNFMIEPLSDSTIYMSFYTISHLLRKLKPDELTPGVFDYVFLGKGSGSAELKKMRESFSYWYPLDWRLSAVELLQNHLTFFIFHHSALFPKEKWPKGIATWGMGLLEGRKMSSSKGNVVMASEALKSYGADTVRLFLFSSVEPWQDFDWRSKEVENYKERLEKFYNKIAELSGIKDKKEALIDKWLLSEVQKVIEETTKTLEGFQTRKASLQAFFRMNEIIKWYERRGGRNKEAVSRIVRDWIKLLTPFIPHTCEELWEISGNKGFISLENWPVADKKLMDKRLEKMEELVKQTLDDINEVIKIVKKKPKEIRIYVAPVWKHIVYNEIFEGIKDKEKINPELMKIPEVRKEGKQALWFAEALKKDIGKLKEILTEEEELKILQEAKEFFEKEFSCRVKVLKALESKSDRALRAQPGKPGIELV